MKIQLIRIYNFVRLISLFSYKKGCVNGVEGVFEGVICYIEGGKFSPIFPFGDCPICLLSNGLSTASEKMDIRVYFQLYQDINCIL